MEKTQGKLEIVLRYFSAFTEQQQQQLNLLEPLYRHWNQQINVISRKDLEGLYEKHVLHSLAIAACYDFPAGLEILDLGTGGGFPGIPLAIFFPDVRFLLVDSIGKKLKVVQAVCAEAGIENVEVRHARVEEIQGRQVDFVVSRAVAPLKDLWRWSKPLLKRNRPMEAFKSGLICLKGGDLAQEISDSGLRPHVQSIASLFPEPFFTDKYILYVPI
jgi:16S rRNA (guanine527-N7)-methyltransferase